MDQNLVQDCRQDKEYDPLQKPAMDEDSPHEPPAFKLSMMCMAWNT